MAKKLSSTLQKFYSFYRRTNGPVELINISFQSEHVNFRVFFSHHKVSKVIEQFQKLSKEYYIQFLSAIDKFVALKSNSKLDMAKILTMICS